ncbi:hypothetical protein MPTK2_1g20530 [Marchantia polymorpha subsp. ruderalis]
MSVKRMSSDRSESETLRYHHPASSDKHSNSQGTRHKWAEQRRNLKTVYGNDLCSDVLSGLAAAAGPTAAGRAGEGDASMARGEGAMGAGLCDCIVGSFGIEAHDGRARGTRAGRRAGIGRAHAKAGRCSPTETRRRSMGSESATRSTANTSAQISGPLPPSRRLDRSSSNPCARNRLRIASPRTYAAAAADAPPAPAPAFRFVKQLLEKENTRSSTIRIMMRLFLSPVLFSSVMAAWLRSSPIVIYFFAAGAPPQFTAVQHSTRPRPRPRPAPRIYPRSA